MEQNPYILSNLIECKTKRLYELVGKMRHYAADILACATSLFTWKIIPYLIPTNRKKFHMD